MQITTKCRNEFGGIYYFTKSFEASANARMKIKIYAKTRYILYINDKFAAEGPCRGGEYTRYYDEIDCTDKLCAGENVIKVKILHVREKKVFTTVYKSDNPLLYFEGVTEDENGTRKIYADDSWSCEFDEGHRLVYDDRYFKSTAPNEELLADRRLQKAEIICIKDEEEKLKWGFARDYELLPRPIPMMYYGQEENFTVVKRGDGFIELAAESYVTAHINFVFSGARGSSVKIIYAERYRNGEEVHNRSDKTGELRGKSDIVHLDGGKRNFSPFWFRAFRFIRIEFENDAELVSAKYIKTHYPLNNTGEFECSDDIYNKMYEVSCNTILCCMHEIFVDCPYREQQQYLMDSAIEMMCSFCMSDDTRLIKKMICEFEEAQMPDGFLRANYPCDQIQIIPAFSLFWIMLLKDYLWKTADKEFVRKRVGTVEKIICGFESAADKYKLIPIGRYWDFVDWVPQWSIRGMPDENEGNAITAHNLCYAYALRCAQNICRALGLNGLAHEHAKRYYAIKKAVNTYCYNEEAGLYTDTRETAAYSEHTIVWAILAETMPREALRKMADRIGGEDIAKCTFSMKYYLFRALEKIGRYDSVKEHLKAWKKMLDNNCVTWCENPDSPQSECHGWSSAPMYEFSANVLGVKINAVKRIILIEPHCLDLTYAKGTVPTVFGAVNVSWEIKDNVFTINISKPNSIYVIVRLPDNTVHSFYEENMVYQCSIERG